MLRAIRRAECQLRREHKRWRPRHVVRVRDWQHYKQLALTYRQKSLFRFPPRMVADSDSPQWRASPELRVAFMGAPTVWDCSALQLGEIVIRAGDL